MKHCCGRLTALDHCGFFTCGGTAAASVASDATGSSQGWEGALHPPLLPAEDERAAVLQSPRTQSGAQTRSCGKQKVQGAQFTKW